MLLIVETVAGTLAILLGLVVLAFLWVFINLSIPDYSDDSLLSSTDDGHTRAAQREERWYEQSGRH